MEETARITFPAANDLEKGILAAAVNGGLPKPLEGVLELADFHFEENRQLYSFIIELEKKQKISYGIVLNELKIKGIELEIPTIENYHLLGTIDWYIEKLKEYSRRRKLIVHSKNLINRMTDMDSDVVLCESEMSYVLNNKNEIGGLVHISKLIAGAMDSFEKMARGEKTAISYGIDALDNITGGIEWGDYILLAGRPSTGKTTLAMNVAVNVARSGYPVYLFEIEMTKEKIMERLLCSIAKVNLFKVKVKKIDKEEQGRVCIAMEETRNESTMPIYVESSPFATPAKLRAKTHSIVNRYGRGLVIVDYLQLIKPDRYTGSKNGDVSEISAGLKGICTELSIPMLALSQFSRETEKRDGKPKLSDLRDSGSLEQDADTVIALSAMTKPEIVEAGILKNRNGPTGDIELKYEKQFFKFSNAKEPEQPEYKSPNND